MQKHTPGPWIGAGPSFGDPLPHYTTEILVEAENEDGDCQPICTLPFQCLEAENEANARLIAAAPEMLSALRKAVVLLAGVCVHSPELSPHETYEAVSDAIAKATGAAQ